MVIYLSGLLSFVSFSFIISIVYGRDPKEEESERQKRSPRVVSNRKAVKKQPRESCNVQKMCPKISSLAYS